MAVSNAIKGMQKSLTQQINANMANIIHKIWWESENYFWVGKMSDQILWNSRVIVYMREEQRNFQNERLHLSKETEGPPLEDYKEIHPFSSGFVLRRRQGSNSQGGGFSLGCCEAGTFGNGGGNFWNKGLDWRARSWTYLYLMGQILMTRYSEFRAEHYLKLLSSRRGGRGGSSSGVLGRRHPVLVLVGSQQTSDLSVGGA